MERGTPPVALSPQEEMLIKRLNRVGSSSDFFVSIGTSCSMMRSNSTSKACAERRALATSRILWLELPCLVTLLRGYVGASDAEAVELSLVALRWQMVLDCSGATTPRFSQGALQTFRERMIAHEMDRHCSTGR